MVKPSRTVNPNDLTLFQVADMETNPILKTELGEIVHSRNEQYQSLQGPML